MIVMGHGAFSFEHLDVYTWLIVNVLLVLQGCRLGLSLRRLLFPSQAIREQRQSEARLLRHHWNPPTKRQPNERHYTQPLRPDLLTDSIPSRP